MERVLKKSALNVSEKIYDKIAPQKHVSLITTEHDRLIFSDFISRFVEVFFSVKVLIKPCKNKGNRFGVAMKKINSLRIWFKCVKVTV